VITLALRARRHVPARRAAYCAMAAVAVQFLLGITTLLHGVPVALGGAHQAGAVILLGTIVWLVHRLDQP